MSAIYSDKHGEYCLIGLTQGQLTQVNADDFEYLNRWKWYARWDADSSVFRGMRNGLLGEGRLGETVILASFVMGEPHGFFVDHKDNNPLNNRRYNLRLSTRTQNNCNRRKAHNKSSQFKGVSWHARTQKWQARIKINGKSIALGYFNEEVDAAVSYQSAAPKVHFEFANIDPLEQRMSYGR